MVNYDSPITSVPQLLALHDRTFIHAAYVSVLGREPDPVGEVYYLARLRAGAPKLQILKQLRRSAEGRAFIPAVAGLDWAIKRHVWATLAIIGPIIRLFSGEECNSALHRQLRMVTNILGRIQEEQASLFGELAMLRRERAAPATSSQGGELGAIASHESVQADGPSPTRSLPRGLSRHPEHSPITLDSAERRVLSTLSLFSATTGAAS